MKFSPISLLFLLPTLTLAQDNDMACADAAMDADCETCLTAGCVHAVGECMSSCDFIADAACWDMQYHEGKTVEEVCATKAEGEADDSICAAEEAQANCGACTGTLKSDGESPCQWYSPVGSPAYCGKGGCDMNGECGSAVCDIISGGGDGPCGGFDLCEPCLNSRLECAWIADSCQPNCDAVADAACYHPSESAFEGMTGPEICAAAVADAADGTHPCNNLPACEPCLNTRMDCAWTAESCQPSCNVADAACYHPSESGFANMTGPEICAKANGSDETNMDENMESKDNSAATAVRMGAAAALATVVAFW